MFTGTNIVDLMINVVIGAVFAIIFAVSFIFGFNETATPAAIANLDNPWD
jgi:hypothetical protein